MNISKSLVKKGFFLRKEALVYMCIINLLGQMSIFNSGMTR